MASFFCFLRESQWRPLNSGFRAASTVPIYHQSHWRPYWHPHFPLHPGFRAASTVPIYHQAHWKPLSYWHSNLPLTHSGFDSTLIANTYYEYDERASLY